MKHTLLTAIFALIVSIIPVAMPALASAACPADNTAKGQVVTGIGATGADCTGSTVTPVIKSIVNFLSYAVGVVAVIMIMVAGFLYVTSGGDAGRIKTAKNTLIYAAIGLVVAALAQFIVLFVLDKAVNH